jgi:hypothetical protein
MTRSPPSPASHAGVSFVFIESRTELPAGSVLRAVVAFGVKAIFALDQYAIVTLSLK